MRLLPFLLRSLSLLPLSSLAAAATSSSSNQNTPSTDPTTGSSSASAAGIITLRIPVSAALPNPYTLSPSTHATLSTAGQKTQTAWLSTGNAFVFRNVAAGSYLVDFYCATHAFAPLRLDVDGDGRARAWETYRGNDWGNKGAKIGEGEAEVGAGGGAGGVFDVRVLGTKGYFMERAKFNFFSILKNPMVLLGLVSMGIFIGMPYLVDNMDPEMRAEWEERQKSNPMNGIMGAAQGGGQNPVGNFDMAAFLAGSAKKDDAGAAISPGPEQQTPGKSGKGKKGR